MKPNFALSLSSDGIGLLHRTGAAQWHLVGEVALDTADLSAQLAVLREKAVALEPSGVTTKLVIPDAQIRYLDLPAGESPDADHEAAAMRALDGATPYALDDLAFDWNVAGGRLHVAAVARETLQEAESFAREHRFNPVCFVARPEAHPFGAEPSFGDIAQAGARVERDPTPIAISGAARLPEAEDHSGAGTVPAPQPSVNGPLRFARPDAGQDGATRGATAESVLTAIRAARDLPDTGAPNLAGAARQAGQQDGQGAVASPAPAAASLAPRRKDPVDPDPVPLRRPRAPNIAAAPDPSRGRDRSDPSHGRDKTNPSRGAAAAADTGGASADDEADRLTIFGARDTQRSRRGKPRFLGLILTAVLLLLLAAVAAWAAIYPESTVARLVRWSEPEIALTPESPAPSVSDLAPGTAPQGAEDGGPEVALAPRPEAIIPPGADAPSRATSQAAQEPLMATDPPTQGKASVPYAGTDIWQMPPDPPVQPDAGSLDDFYLTSIDADLPVGDAVALPDMPGSHSDTRPETPAAPAPPGTSFAFDARGLVVATREGALTPDGVEVRTGPPPIAPPDTPLRAVPVPGLTPSPEVAAELVRISGIRPRTRPGDLIERNERGAMGGRSRIEMASLRPRARPATLPQAAAAAVADASAVGAAVAEAAASPGPDEDALSQAVTASLKPRPRPGDLAPPARREAPQPQTARRETPPQQAARTEVLQPQAVAPRIPSTASVARTATTRNAINLRQVNLIGVYGSASNRRALVRLSNGRYAKVEVGDRLDGGRVSAIGDGELRYTKRGRSVILRMPSG